MSSNYGEQSPQQGNWREIQQISGGPVVEIDGAVLPWVRSIRFKTATYHQLLMASGVSASDIEGLTVRYTGYSPEAERALQNDTLNRQVGWGRLLPGRYDPTSDTVTVYAGDAAERVAMVPYMLGDSLREATLFGTAGFVLEKTAETYTPLVYSKSAEMIESIGKAAGKNAREVLTSPHTTSLVLLATTAPRLALSALATALYGGMIGATRDDIDCKRAFAQREKSTAKLAGLPGADTFLEVEPLMRMSEEQLLQWLGKVSGKQGSRQPER